MLPLYRIDKRANEPVQYIFDFNPWLQSIGSTAASFSVTDSPDLVESSSNVNQVLVLNLTGGDQGETYRIGVQCTAANGLIRNTTLEVKVLGVRAPSGGGDDDDDDDITVIDSLAGNSTTDAPSVRAVNAGLAARAALADGISGAERTKLAGIATGATANATDALLRDRTTHTGVQPLASITGLQTALDAKIAATEKGAPNGVATLGGDGKLLAAQLPSSDAADFLGVAADETAMLALIGSPGDYCTRSDTGTTWVLIGADPSVIESWSQLAYPSSPVTSVAGKQGIVLLNKADVGLSNVDNTADMDKPVSTDMLAGLATKALLVHQHTIEEVTGLAGTLDQKSDVTHVHPISAVTGLQTALDSKAPSAHNQSISTVTGLQAALDSKLSAFSIPEVVSGTSYVFTAEDSSKTKVFTNPAGCSASANESTLPLGWYCNWIVGIGAGTLTFGGSADVRSLGGALTASSELASGAIVSQGEDEFLVVGALGTLTAAAISDFDAAVLALVGNSAASVEITGTRAVGQTLTATLPSGFLGDFQWTRDGVDIAGATDTGVNSSDYTIVSADAETDVNVEVANRVLIGEPQPIPPEDVGATPMMSSLSENFDGAELNDTDFENGYWRGAASAQVVSQSGGTLNIPALTGVAGNQFNGRLQKTPRDFTNDRVFAGNLTRSSDVSTAHAMQFAVFSSQTVGVRWFIKANQISASTIDNAPQVTVGSAFTYSPTTHYWLGIKHNSATDEILFQTAPSTASNPPIESDWVTQRTAARPAGLTLAACKAALNAGTDASTGTTGTAKYGTYNGAA